MKFTVKVDGLKEIQAALHKLPKATAKNIMRRILRGRAKPIADMAQQLAPVDTGYLKQTVAVSSKLARSVRRKRQKLSENSVEIFIGPSAAPRAHMQEFGTFKEPPQPYMRPAWDKYQDTILEDIGKDLWAEIEKAAGRIARKAAKQSDSGEGTE